MMVFISIVGTFSLSNFLCIVEPVYILNVFRYFLTEANWFNVQIFKAFVVRIANQILCFSCHKFWIEPVSEHISVG